jgi:hypothetical protein
MKFLTPQLIFVGSVVIGIALLVLLPFGAYVSAYNVANTFEQQIPAIYEDNEQTLGQYGQKLQEAAQIPTMMADDWARVFQGVMMGRYGEDGVEGALLLIKEQNPNLDSKVYVQLQQIIEAGRDEFANKQQKLIDVKRAYRTSLGSFWTGTFMKVAGYPKLKIGYPDLKEDDYPAITTGRANKVFQNGIEEGPIVLRPTIKTTGEIK